MPEPLPTSRAALELAVRGLIAAVLIEAGKIFRIGETAPFDDRAIPRVYKAPIHVNGEPEWLQVAAISHPQGNKETRVVFVEFLAPQEHDVGACDQTIVTLNYGIDVLFSQVNKRRDGSNSHDDFTAYVMRAGELFKENRSFGYKRSEIEHMLLQTDTPARVELTDFATVHRINLSLAVEVG